MTRVRACVTRSRRKSKWLTMLTAVHYSSMPAAHVASSLCPLSPPSHSASPVLLLFSAHLRTPRFPTVYAAAAAAAAAAASLIFRLQPLVETSASSLAGRPAVSHSLKRADSVFLLPLGSALSSAAHTPSGRNEAAAHCQRPLIMQINWRAYSDGRQSTIPHLSRTRAVPSRIRC